MRIHKLSSFVGLLASATSVAAQAGLNCRSGPGSAFGIIGYQCANCGFKNEPGQRPSYTFFAEPVITQLDRPAAFASTRPLYVIDGVVQGRIDGVVQGTPELGDVIEAVDGHPITTQAGADLFAYPSPGTHSMTVRRGRERETLEFSVPASCDSPSVRIRGTPRLGAFSARADSLRYIGDTVYIRGDSVSRGAGSAAALATTVSGTIDGIRRGSGSGYGRGVPAMGGEAVTVSSGTGGSGSGVATTVSSPAVGKFGFAVECRPSCTMRRRANGEYYFKYDGYPRIIEVREKSAADRAGLRVGDLITKVEGRSILADDALHDTDQRDQLHMTVRRDGKDIDVVMVVSR